MAKTKAQRRMSTECFKQHPRPWKVELGPCGMVIRDAKGVILADEVTNKAAALISELVNGVTSDEVVQSVEVKPTAVTVTFTKTVTNCTECPNFMAVDDPDPHDSFCSDDVAGLCKAMVNVDRIARWSDQSTFPHRPVTTSCRPHRLKEECDIPKWCPFLAQTSKVICAPCHQGRHADDYHACCPDDRCQCSCKKTGGAK